MAFHADTAIEALAPTRFSAGIHEGLDIVGNANGGYLMALAASAAAGRCSVADSRLP